MAESFSSYSRLAGRAALITGAASGIGRATALLFGREGARVAVVDLNEAGARDTAEEIRAGGGEAIWLGADVSQASAVDRIVDLSLAEFRRLDILVNNAGIGGRRAGSGSLLETSEEAWDRIMAVNLKGAFLLCQAVVARMIPQKRGVVINIASVFGLVGFAGLSAYGAAKSGLINLTRSLAIDYGPQGIRVNAIAPGVIQTPMIEERLEDPTYQRRMIEAVPLARLGTPQDVAQGALFLASDEAGYISGHTLVIDGGWLA